MFAGSRNTQLLLCYGVPRVLNAVILVVSELFLALVFVPCSPVLVTSRPPTVCFLTGGVSVVVILSIVGPAQGEEIVDCGFTTVLPGLDVVGFAINSKLVTSFDAAEDVVDGESGTLLLGSVTLAF